MHERRGDFCIFRLKIAEKEGKTAQLGVNRRLQLPDGRTIIGINLEGVIDRAVDVIRVDDLEGTTMATIMSTAVRHVPRLTP